MLENKHFTSHFKVKKPKNFNVNKKFCKMHLLQAAIFRRPFCPSWRLEEKVPASRSPCWQRWSHLQCILKFFSILNDLQFLFYTSTSKLCSLNNAWNADKFLKQNKLSFFTVFRHLFFNNFLPDDFNQNMLNLFLRFPNNWCNQLLTRCDEDVGIADERLQTGCFLFWPHHSRLEHQQL